MSLTVMDMIILIQIIQWYIIVYEKLFWAKTAYILWYKLNILSMFYDIIISIKGIYFTVRR